MKAALVIAMLALAPLWAETVVTFDTTGFFSSTGSDLLPIGGGLLEFKDLSLTTVEAPSVISIGEFDTAAVDGGGSVPAGETFTLTIDQIAPSSGDATTVGHLIGAVKQNQSGIFVDFAPQDLNIGLVSYHLKEQAGGYPILPPDIEGGITPLQTVVEVVPEPAPGTTLALLLSALVVWRVAPRKGQRTLNGNS